MDLLAIFIIFYTGEIGNISAMEGVKFHALYPIHMGLLVYHINIGLIGNIYNILYRGDRKYIGDGGCQVSCTISYSYGIIRNARNKLCGGG